jgi:hypothetical protein
MRALTIFAMTWSVACATTDTKEVVDDVLTESTARAEAVMYVRSARPGASSVAVEACANVPMATTQRVVCGVHYALGGVVTVATCVVTQPAGSGVTVTSCAISDPSGEGKPPTLIP